MCQGYYQVVTTFFNACLKVQDGTTTKWYVPFVNHCKRRFHEEESFRTHQRIFCRASQSTMPISEALFKVCLIPLFVTPSHKLFRIQYWTILVAALLNLIFKHVRKAISNKVVYTQHSLSYHVFEIVLQSRQFTILESEWVSQKTLRSLELERKLRAFF